GCQASCSWRGCLNFPQPCALRPPAGGLLFSQFVVPSGDRDAPQGEKSKAGDKPSRMTAKNQSRYCFCHTEKMRAEQRNLPSKHHGLCLLVKIATRARQATCEHTVKKLLS